MKPDKAKQDANVILDTIKHPENYCQVCWKKVGVCKHTRYMK